MVPQSLQRSGGGIAPAPVLGRLAIVLLPVLALTLTTTAARAEVVQLLDNTQISGKILHYYDGVFEIETAGGQKLELPTTKIKSITFKLPPPRPEFSTPDKTFGRYREALAKGDVTKLIDCYALMYQGLLQQQMHEGQDDLKKMQKEFEGAKFEVKGSKITGTNAVLKIQRTKGEDVENTELRLVQENGEWKMTP